MGKLNVWNDGSNEFFIRKIYFSGQDCYYLCYVAHKNN